MAVGVGHSGNGYDGHHSSGADEGARSPLAALTAVAPFGKAFGHRPHLYFIVLLHSFSVCS